MVISFLKVEIGRLSCQRMTKGKDVLFLKGKMGRFCFRGLKWDGCLDRKRQNVKVVLLLKDKMR